MGKVPGGSELARTLETTPCLAWSEGRCVSRPSEAFDSQTSPSTQHPSCEYQDGKGKCKVQVGKRVTQKLWYTQLCPQCHGGEDNGRWDEWSAKNRSHF